MDVDKFVVPLFDVRNVQRLNDWVSALNILLLSKVRRYDVYISSALKYGISWPWLKKEEWFFSKDFN
jgi:hypothetical protein